MKKDVISKAFDYIDDSYIREAAMLSPDRKGGEENEQVKKIIYTRKIIKVAIIAAVLMSLFTATALGVESYVNSPQRAEQIARQELAKMQEMGLLSEEITINDPITDIRELEEKADKTLFFGRQFKHRYSVRSWGGKYTVMLDVDTDSGEIRNMTIEAKADENDERIEGRKFEAEVPDPYYYNNFDDIFDPEMTIDQLCIKLAKYWGFKGYTLSGTVDNFYQYNTAAPDGSALLSSICDEPYLTVYFDGDQENVPMYIELVRFPGHMCLIIGTTHLLG